jgi:methylthioribose-1-phosphate isomerase
MKVDGKQTRPIWFDDQTTSVKIIDQRQLPHRFEVITLDKVADVLHAIVDMAVRGAPLIGVTAAYGVYVAAKTSPEGRVADAYLRDACAAIRSARPTATNLAWAVDRVLSQVIVKKRPQARIAAALGEAQRIAELEIDNCRRIGEHGYPLIEALSREKNGTPVNILTHCNAGWLACVEYGTATAPIYTAFDRGIDLHIWVDETRPLNQGARLTAWELGKHGIAHTVITDNAGGHLMQHGLVDMVIVGTDRATLRGDVANKIGTYLKALAACDNGLPFYVALPSSTIDWAISDGLAQIPIESRDGSEVHWVQGETTDGQITQVRIPPADSPAGNFAFDVTPARLVTGLITERGVCQADEASIMALFPEQKPA